FLAVLRKAKQTGLSLMIQGIAAVQDGRLEEGARYAAKALEDSSVSESRKPFVKSYATLTRLALAVAYLGTGEYVKAEAALKQVEAFFDLKDRTPEEQAIMEQMIRSKEEMQLQFE